MDELREKIAQYLDEQKLMQLCTIGEDGSPWACNVWQAADDELNVYYFSSITRRHSEEVEADDRVAGALAVPQTPSDTPRGLQFEGVAKKLTSEEDIKHARSLFEGRIFDAETIDGFMNHPEKPHMFYKITPKQFVLFDVVSFPDSPRQEYSL